MNPEESRQIPLSSGTGAEPDLTTRSKDLQDSLSALSDRLKKQNRSLSELRSKVRSIEGRYGVIKNRARHLTLTPRALPAKPQIHAKTPVVSALPALIITATPVKKKSPTPPVEAVPYYQDVLVMSAPLPRETESGFLRPALALLLLSAVAYGSANLQDTFSTGLQGIAALETSGTRPPLKKTPVRRPSPKKAAAMEPWSSSHGSSPLTKRAAAMEPRSSSRGRSHLAKRAPAYEPAAETFSYLPRKLPSIHWATDAAIDEEGPRKALRLVYSFRPPQWRHNVLETLEVKGSDPLDSEPIVERLDRDLYLVTFHSKAQGQKNQTYEFEADVVGLTVFIRPGTVSKLAYLQ